MPSTEPRRATHRCGGDEWLDDWPKGVAWDVVAAGRGHDAVDGSTWLAAVHAVDLDMMMDIEHEDTTLGRTEGLEVAAGVLRVAAHGAGVG